jgi:L-ascorbate metabolism protein UlaG (beta-lactamase superfamily)
VVIYVNTTNFGGVKITYFGHASLLFEYLDTLIYVDPYVISKDCRPADLILHTHGHHDHAVVPNSIMRPSTTIISKGGKSPGLSVEPGSIFKFSGVKIEAVHAYNVDKEYHKKGEGVGYILTFTFPQRPIIIYVAGDTDLIPEIEKIKCDVAILPIGGKYTMDIDDASRAAATIKPKVVIPYHYNYLLDTKADASRFKDLISELSDDIDVRILTPQ